MELKDLEEMLQGSVKFILQARDKEGYIKDLDVILPYEIKYLPSKLRTAKILKIDLDENIIFLKIDEIEDEKWVKSEIDEAATIESLEKDLQNIIEDKELI